jgi:hypothetical protein
VVSFFCGHSHDDETPWCRSYSMVKVHYYNSYLTTRRPYSCSRYCVLCRSYTFSRLNSTLSLCLLKSAKACTTFQSWQQSSPMNGSSTISSNTDMPHQSHSRPFHPCDTTHHISVKNVSHATRMMLSISSKPSSHSVPSAPSGKASSTAASLLLGSTPPPQGLQSVPTLQFRSTREQ